MYYEVYKLRRLPRSPLWGLEWIEELAAKIVSSMKDLLGQKGGKLLQGIEEPALADVQPPKSKTPRRGRRETSTERDLTEVREAHWRAQATVAALEENIEQPNWSITQGQSDICAHSWSWDHCRRRSWRQNRRCHRVWPEESSAPSFKYSPPWWGPGSGEDEEGKPPLLDFDLEVDHFFQ